MGYEIYCNNSLNDHMMTKIVFALSGHVRPLCNIVPHIVKNNRVHVTLLVSDALYERAKVEIARNFDHTEQNLHELVR